MTNSIPTLNTKGGLKFKVRYDTTISATDVINYISNDVLQLPVKPSLRTIHGPGKGCYVIAVLAFAAEDIAVTAAPTSFTDKVLVGYGSGTKYKKDVLDKIKPFMLPTPDQFALSMRNPEFAKRLADIGIWGNNLKEINTFFFAEFDAFVNEAASRVRLNAAELYIRNSFTVKRSLNAVQKT